MSTRRWSEMPADRRVSAGRCTAVSAVVKAGAGQMFLQFLSRGFFTIEFSWA